MEHFTQTNVFAWIRTVFAQIQTIFAYLIIGCAIRYLKIGNLHYSYCNNMFEATQVHNYINNLLGWKGIQVS